VSAAGFDRRRVSELAGRRKAEKPGSSPGFFSFKAPQALIGAALERAIAEWIAEHDC
jgi:hypothetical protein